ncbi:unnamed protein product [Phytomonas sp. Hart1]|nr:unnamed protein product [Phytomonas sp. Hart1]|eukprot:CCW71147.1 unnamed protein product [Phytomonas sp. isolate Hart1]
MSLPYLRKSSLPSTGEGASMPTPLDNLPVLRRQFYTTVNPSQDPFSGHVWDQIHARCRFQTVQARPKQVSIVEIPDQVVERRRFGRSIEAPTEETTEEVITPRRVHVAQRPPQATSTKAKPYPHNRAYRHKMNFTPYSLGGNPMANYIMKMQSQRPTKGLYSFH